MAKQKLQTDRRTVYTKNVIKNALVEAMQKKQFQEIGVAELCRLADVSRSTFYVHYKNTYEVLTEAIDDVISGFPNMFSRLSLKCGGNDDSCENTLCQIIQNRSKYRALFFDNSIDELLIDRIADKYMAAFVRELCRKSQLTPKQAESVFFFRIGGCISACKAMSRGNADDWHEIQPVIDGFIKGGLQVYYNSDDN